MSECFSCLDSELYKRNSAKIQLAFNVAISSKAENVQEILPVYDDSSEMVDARLIIRNNFDKIFETYPETLIFGEDAGNIGDVNQGLEGIQEKYGECELPMRESVKLVF